MAKDYDAGDTAGIFNTDIAHCITSSTHVCIFPSVPQCKHPSQPALQKRMTWNFGAKCIPKKKKKKKKYGLPFLKQTAILVMLMNQNTTQHCRILRLAQTVFTPQFLKADDTSITSGLANHASDLLKLGITYPSSALHFTREHSNPQNNTVRLFWSINFTWKFKKEKIFLW